MSTKLHSAASAGRTRRNVVKALGLVLGSLGTVGISSKTALARHHGGGGGGACFLRGTQIRTSRGYRRIETLKSGDLVSARFGGMTPIHKIDSFFVARDEGALPVRVARSALGDNVPAIDLWLTGPHAIYVDNVLISVCNLVNDTTIAFDDTVGGDELEFFHIELARHDVIDAQGLACESRLTSSMTPCAPRLCLNGARSEFRSRLRSAAAAIVDRRTAFDVVRDRVEERSLSL